MRRIFFSFDPQNTQLVENVKNFLTNIGFYCIIPTGLSANKRLNLASECDLYLFFYSNLSESIEYLNNEICNLGKLMIPFILIRSNESDVPKGSKIYYLSEWTWMNSTNPEFFNQLIRNIEQAPQLQKNNEFQFVEHNYSFDETHLHYYKFDTCILSEKTDDTIVSNIKDFLSAHNIKWTNLVSDVAESTVILYVHSCTSNISSVIDEAIVKASSDGKNILVFRLDNTPYKGNKIRPLNMLNWIDGMPFPKSQFDVLLYELNHILGRKEPLDEYDIKALYNEVEAGRIKINYISQLANKGNPKANGLLGIIAYNGILTGREGYENSIYYFKKAADAGEPYSMLMLGVYLLENEKTEDGITWLKKAAEAGLVEAPGYLAEMYYDNNDLEEMKKWANYGISIGDTGSYEVMGRYYYQNKDYENAFNCFSSASEKGNAISQLLLGEFYEEGHFVSKDINKAFYYYRLSADNGEVVAFLALGRCYLHGKGVEKNHELAVESFKYVVDKGNAWGLPYLGECYEFGYGVAASLDTAMQLYEQGVENNVPYAYYMLGKLYLYGKGVMRDKEKAVELLNTAAEGDCEEAVVELNKLNYGK